MDQGTWLECVGRARLVRFRIVTGIGIQICDQVLLDLLLCEILLFRLLFIRLLWEHDYNSSTGLVQILNLHLALVVLLLTVIPIILLIGFQNGRFPRFVPIKMNKFKRYVS